MRRRTLIFFFLLSFAFGGVAYAQPSGGVTTTRFTGLDVTILIDQSGSMWGFPRQKGGPTQNDKYNHRIGQTKNLIYRLAEHVEGTPLIHRLSMIDFGDNATVTLSNYVIRYNPADPGGALREVKTVVERAVVAKDLVNTNTPEAMRRAFEEYEKMEASGLPLPGRKRVMLIVTDGRANIPGAMPAEMKGRIEAQAKALRERREGKVDIWVVGLNDASNYWNDGDGAFWESVTGTGRARLAETASSKISTIVQGIVDEWLGAESAPFVGDEYQCPPYLRRIVFAVNMGFPRSPVAIVDPNGNELPLSSGGATVSPGTFARFAVEDPKPGIYKIRKDPSRSYTPEVEVTSANIKRLSPAGAASLEAPARIVFQAMTGRGTPLELLSEWPIKASVMITSPSGAVTEIPAEFQEDGKFAAKWQPPQIGAYRVRLKGLVTLKSGDYDVFGANASSYDETLKVNRLHLYWLQLEDPDPASGIRVMSPASSANLVFSLVDTKNQKVTNLSGLVSDPATWLSLQLVDKSGVALAGAPMPLITGADGTFTTSLPVRLDWLKGEGWWMPGQLHFRVLAQPKRLIGENFLDSIRLPEEAESQRVGGDPMTVGPLKLRFSWLILGPLLLVTFGLLLGGAWALGSRILPGGLIWWADSKNGRSVMVKVFDADSDPDGFYARKFSATSWHEFKYDRQFHVSIDGQDYVAITFRVKRALLIDRVEAEVRYSWQHEPTKTYTVKLRKDRIERLKGLPRTEYAVSLEKKP